MLAENSVNSVKNQQSQHQKLCPKKWIKGSWNLSHSFLDSSKEPVLP